MDLDYLFHRHQVSLAMAAGAAGSEARSAHHRMADRYAARIARARADAGLGAR